MLFYKPIAENRFELEVDRFLNGQGNFREKLKYLTVKSKVKITSIKIGNIEFINASGNYLVPHIVLKRDCFTR